MIPVSNKIMSMNSTIPFDTDFVSLAVEKCIYKSPVDFYYFLFSNEQIFVPKNLNFSEMIKYLFALPIFGNFVYQ